MSGVHDDLALREDMEYLRAVLTYGAADAYVETASLNALGRVEAEIGRLEQIIEAKEQLLIAYRVGDPVRADRALTKLRGLEL